MKMKQSTWQLLLKNSDSQKREEARCRSIISYVNERNLRWNNSFACRQQMPTKIAKYFWHADVERNIKRQK